MHFCKVDHTGLQEHTLQTKFYLYGTQHTHHHHYGNQKKKKTNLSFSIPNKATRRTTDIDSRKIPCITAKSIITGLQEHALQTSFYLYGTHHKQQHHYGKSKKRHV